MEAPDVRYTTARDGTRIAYGVYSGAGKPILNVGWPGSTTLPMAHEIPAWVACMEAMCGGRPNVKVDLRGTGFSEPAPGPITVVAQATDLEAGCEAIGEAMDVVSWCGASIPVVTLAVQRPDLFHTLTLVAPDYEGWDSHYGALWEARRSMPELDWLETIIRRGMDVAASDVRGIAHRWLQFSPEEAARAHMDAFLGASLEGVIGKLGIPTGVFSYRLAQRQAERVAQAIPGCVYRFVESLHTGAEGGRRIRLLMDAVCPAGSSYEPASNGSNARLSEREQEVLQLIAGAKSNRTIATDLGIDVRTVERHVQNVLNKLGVHNRTAAANWAIRNGLA